MAANLTQAGAEALERDDHRDDPARLGVGRIDEGARPIIGAGAFATTCQSTFDGVKAYVTSPTNAGRIALPAAALTGLLTISAKGKAYPFVKSRWSLDAAGGPAVKPAPRAARGRARSGFGRTVAGPLRPRLMRRAGLSRLQPDRLLGAPRQHRGGRDGDGEHHDRGADP
ncbi:MAG TPA: hypothetical protein VMY78_10985 [Solirubrobacteraceae bacterium]|nr:hypothetical protein [Solirubrobacteraceae bacterium]